MTALAVILAITYIGVFGFAQRLYLIIRDEIDPDVEVEENRTTPG